MKPVEFKEQNIVFAKDQTEYQPLPALKIKGNEGHVISCWKLSLKERLKVLFTGRVWLDLMSFNQPLTPSYISVDKNELFIIENDKPSKFKTLIRKLEVRLRYVRFCIKNSHTFHIGDIVVYNGEDYILINGAGNPTWKLKRLSDNEIIHANCEKFKAKNKLKAFIHRFKFDWNFQMSSWYSIDCRKAIGKRISYKNSSNIVF